MRIFNGFSVLLLWLLSLRCAFTRVFPDISAPDSIFVESHRISFCSSRLLPFSSLKLSKFHPFAGVPSAVWVGMNPVGVQNDLGAKKVGSNQTFFSFPGFGAALLVDFGAGTVAGGAGVLAGYPLDTIRVRTDALYAPFACSNSISHFT